MPDTFNNQMLTSDELRKLNIERQTGVPQEDELEEPIVEQDTVVPQRQEGRPASAFESVLNSWGERGNTVQDIAGQAIRSGYGTSRYDANNPYYPGMDLQDMRAREQSDFAKIGMGMTKMATTALATAANTTVGTVFGAFSAGAEAVKQAAKGDMNAREILNAGVNNPVSEWLIRFQQQADEWFPNYRTEEERSEQYQREWYKHMGDANFIGDVFIKNLGFTLGAMAGGAAWTRAFAPIIRKASADILKGAVAAVAGDADAKAAMDGAVNAWRTGRMSKVEAEKILQNIKNAGKILNKGDARMQLFGASISAMGEGSAEGLMAKSEFMDQFKQENDRKFFEEYSNLESDILMEGNPDFVNTGLRINPETNRVEKYIELSDEGQRELARRRADVSDKYNNLLANADAEGEKLASTVFLLNLPILTASNLVQFGKMYSGGWNTARSRVRGIRGATNLAEQTGKAGEYARAGIEGGYRSTGNKAFRTIEKGIRNAFSESTEEMLQGTASSGAQQVAMASFNNDGYDPDAISSFRDWFEEMYQGGAEYLGDIKNWQEGAMGALTGIFGVPSFRFQKGKWWSGGIIGAAQEANEEINAERLAAENLNKIVSDKDFQKNFHDYIRLLKYSDQMDEAAVKNDQYAWHTADKAKLITAVMAFSRAGKLDDMMQLVDDYASLTEADASKIRAAFENDPQYRLTTANKSDAEVVDMVKEKAEELKDVITDYKEIYNALLSRAPMDASDDFLEEMIFTAANLRQFEKRFLRMYDETMQTLENSPEAKAVLDTEVREQNPFLDAFNQLRDIRTIVESYFGADPSRPVPKKVEDLFNASISKVEQAVGPKDSEPRKKIEDMKKLVVARREFYDKLQRMQDPKTTKQAQKEFKDQAVTPEKVEEAAEKEIMAQQTEDIDTLDSIKAKFESLPKTERDRMNFEKSLKTIEDKNPAAKQFLAIRAKQKDVGKYSWTHSFENMDPVINDPKYAGMSPKDRMTAKTSWLPYMLSNIYKRADSVDDFDSSKDVFPTAEELQADRGADPRLYPTILEMARQALDNYNAIEEQTGTLDTMPQTPAPQPAQPAPQEPGPGYSVRDESQDSSTGSNTPPPSAPPQKPAPKFEEKPTEAPAPSLQPAPEEAEEAEADDQDDVNDEDEANDQLDGNFVSKEDLDADTEDSDKGQKEYLHGSVPEIDSVQAADARKALARGDDNGIKNADLSDFVTYKKDEDGNYILVDDSRVPEKNEGYGRTWEFMSDAYGFDYLDTEAKVGDRIKFYIYHDAPEYDGKPQIFMVIEDGVVTYPIAALTLDDRKYRGVRQLRADIEAEYENWKADHNPETEDFVFSKETEIYQMMNGLIEYDYNNRAGSNIVDKEGYDPEAPILYISPTKQAFIVRGDKSAMSTVKPEFFDENNINRRKRRGSLYYLAKQPDGHYVPIRLKYGRFNQDTMVQRNDVFDRIKAILGNIASIAHNVDFRNEEEQNQKIKKEVGELSSWLNVKDIDFRIDTVGENKELALVIDNTEKNADGTPKYAPVVFDINSVTGDAITAAVAEFNRSIGVRTEKRRMADGSVVSTETVANLDKFLDAGLLMSNATRMRVKGVDFRAYGYAKDEKGNWGFAVNRDNPETAAEDGGFEEDVDGLLFQIAGTRPSPADRNAALKNKERRRAVTTTKSRIYNELQRVNGITNMQMGDKKLRQKMLSAGVSREVTDFILSGLKEYPSLRRGTPYEAFVQLSRAMSYDIQRAYDEAFRNKVDDALDDKLISLLDKYNIRVRKEDLKKRFGRDDVLGAFDVLEKVIYLANDPAARNQLTMPEEFAHAFVELMGSSINYGADSEDFKFLYDSVADTDFYGNVYETYKTVYVDENGNPDEYRIRKEAIGQALAAALTYNWNQQKLGRNNASFFSRLKEWFDRIIAKFKGENITFEKTIDDIAKEILNDDLSRLNKVDDQGYTLLEYAQTIDNQNRIDNGKALSFMRYFSKLGNIITGSFAYRRQGTVYRGKLDSLHDIDMIVPAEVHGVHNVEMLSKYNFNVRHNAAFAKELLNTPYFRKIKRDYPKIVFAGVSNTGQYLMVNAVYSEDENLSNRFARLTGSYADRLATFTEAERQQMYLFDFFLRTPEDNNIMYDDENELTLVDYKTPFREKLRMGRAKDIYDYQMWKAYDDFASAPSPSDILFQVTSEREKRPEQRFARQARQQERTLEKDMNELPADTRDALEAKGYMAEQYNELPDPLKEQVLRCAGV